MALRGVDEQLDIIKSQMYGWFYTHCGVKAKIYSWPLIGVVKSILQVLS